MDRPVRVLHIYRTYFPDTQGGLEEAIRQTCYSTLGYAEHRIFTLSRNPFPEVIEFPEAVVYRSPLDMELQYIVPCLASIPGVGRVGGCTALPVSVALCGRLAFMGWSWKAGDGDLPVGYRPPAVADADLPASDEAFSDWNECHRRDI